jgi:hypothetical protein
MQISKSTLVTFLHRSSSPYSYGNAKPTLTSSLLRGHGMGALYLLGAGTRQLRTLSLAGQCRSNRSPRSVEGSRLISSSLSRQGMYSLMLSGQTGNFATRILALVAAPSLLGSCGTTSPMPRSVLLALPMSKSSCIAPSSPTMPRRADGGGGEGRTGGGGEALAAGEAGGAVAGRVGIRDG